MKAGKTGLDGTMKKMLQAGGLVLMGALCIGTVLPGARAWAITPSEKGGERHTTNVTLDADWAATDFEPVAASLTATGDDGKGTFEEFISGMTCTGCGRRCPLTALKCARGDDALRKAREEYEKTASVTSSTLALDAGEAKGEDASGKLLGDIMSIAPMGGLVAGGIYAVRDRRTQSAQRKG